MTEPNQDHQENLSGRLKGLARALKHQAQHAVAATKAATKKWLGSHRECMRGNRNYRQAILTGTTAIVTAMTLDPVVAAVITTAVAVYVAAFQSDDGPFDGWRSDDPYRTW